MSNSLSNTAYDKTVGPANTAIFRLAGYYIAIYGDSHRATGPLETYRYRYSRYIDIPPNQPSQHPRGPGPSPTTTYDRPDGPTTLDDPVRVEGPDRRPYRTGPTNFPGDRVGGSDLSVFPHPDDSVGGEEGAG